MPPDFWQATRSCMVPMTLSSFIVPRPPVLSGVAMTLMWTTVSTSSLAITLAITGLRTSARTKETSPRSPRGGTASTPITRSTPGSVARRRANLRPRSRETPVTRTTFLLTRSTALPSSQPRGGGLLAELASLDAGLLQQLAVLLLRHPLASLLDDRTHEYLFRPTCPGSRTGREYPDSLTAPRVRSRIERSSPRQEVSPRCRSSSGGTRSRRPR